jgi:phage shock protein C
MHELYKKLWRSRKDRKIAGVCGGLGAYFGVDPVLIRILFIFFLFIGGTALLAYILLWIVTPLKSESWQDK